jgi:integrase
LASAEKEGADPFAIAAIRFLALSGCRKSEVLTLRWRPDPDGAGYVDFERGSLHLAESKTGSKVVPLGAPALELLANLPRIEGNPHVFPGNTPGGHFIGLQKVWNRLREKTGLAGVRIHDLRHGFASVAVAGGDSLFLVGKVLGHRQAGTTERYAHLADDPVRAVADKAARQIASAMTAKKDDSEVVSLPQRKA